ncbi:hypothetical protein DB347_00805 [Opitutaceae bacterium EW11]|nr:hypothetical protein DB347_00805 [Opitutaceae bacterium EW11]
MKLLPILIPTLLVAGGSALVVMQHLKTVELERRAEGGAFDDPVLQQLRLEHQRLASTALSDDALVKLKTSEAEAARLRSDVLELWSRLETKGRASPEALKPEAGWQNKGSADPRSAIETAVWAGLQGDVDTLAKLLTFDPTGRARAEAFFRDLPPKLQSEYGDAEHVFATLTAARIPLGTKSINVAREVGNSADSVTLSVLLDRGNGPPRPADFTFRRSGDSWKLVVPDNIVASYEGRLKTGR